MCRYTDDLSACCIKKEKKYLIACLSDSSSLVDFYPIHLQSEFHVVVVTRGANCSKMSSVLKKRYSF
jgi:hypothetical protein